MRLPFIAQVVFTRGQFCPHSTDRQCNVCFITTMTDYADVVGDVGDMMANYMREHRVADITRMDTFTVTISPDEPLSAVHATGSSR